MRINADLLLLNIGKRLLLLLLLDYQGPAAIPWRLRWWYWLRCLVFDFIIAGDDGRDEGSRERRKLPCLHSGVVGRRFATARLLTLLFGLLSPSAAVVVVVDDHDQALVFVDGGDCRVVTVNGRQVMAGDEAPIASLLLVVVAPKFLMLLLVLLLMLRQER